MYQPTGNSLREYLFRVPLHKLEHFLQFSGEEISPEEYALAKEILRLRKQEIALREQYPRHLLEQWDKEQLRQLLRTALEHKPLWVYEDIVQDILDIWHAEYEASPIKLTDKERQHLRKIWKKTQHR